MDDKGLENATHRARGVKDWTPGNLDYFVIDQNWDSYTAEEHETWRILYERQEKNLDGRGVRLWYDCMRNLGITRDRIPKIEEVNDILMAATGWQVVPVSGIIPDAAFFELLAARRFPTGQFIRTRDQLDYIQEPDIFHDMFGHVPLLAIPVFADHMQAFGHGGIKALRLDALEEISRLYWFTIEMGLINTERGLRIYGAGILSGAGETKFCLDDPSPNRIKFNVKRIMRTKYRIDDFQESYFVLDSFEQLFEETDPDFTPVYEEVKALPLIEMGELVPDDDIIHSGTQDYAKSKGRV